MTKTFNYRQFFRILGLLLCIEAIFMLAAACVALCYREPDVEALFTATGITAAAALAGLLAGYKAERHIGTREGYSVVAVVWVVFSLFGMLPFLMSGCIPSPINAFFETISGFTTTGATILDNVETLPHGLQLWRCVTQWLGGMGIVVLSLALLPFFGGGMQLFMAEVPGPTYDKLQPRLKNTARRLWALYVALTLLETMLLKLGGMTLFDAVCHAFSTMGSGGYSTKQDSIAHWTSPFIQYTIIVFMLITGINYTLLYLAIVKRQFGRFLKDEELRTYLTFILIATIAVTFGLGCTQTPTDSGFAATFRKSLFQVSSIISTTGFSTADYTLWHPMLQLVLILLMFSGASAGSTSGGMKVVRLLLLAKNGYYEMKRLIHPKAVLPVRINGHVVPEKTINSIHAFIIIYVGLIIGGTFVVALSGLPISESFGTSLACISNVGQAVGSFGPAGNYAALPGFTKLFLSFLMLVGRLELFTVLILFSPGFWKK